MNSKKHLVEGWFLEELLEFFESIGLDHTAEYIQNVLEEDASLLQEAKETLDFLEENATLRTEQVGEGSGLVDHWWEVAYLPEVTCLEGEQLSFKEYIQIAKESLLIEEEEEYGTLH